MEAVEGGKPTILGITNDPRRSQPNRKMRFQFECQPLHLCTSREFKFQEFEFIRELRESLEALLKYGTQIAGHAEPGDPHWCPSSESCGSW